MTAVFKKIWQLLTENDFKDEIPQKYHCLICKDVAILANSTICGYIFCDECITNYMKDGMKKCPGKRNECTEEPLVLNDTFSKDTAIWVYMSKLIVKCPYGTCEEMCAIENMIDHVQDCAMITVKCPYEKVGCKGEKSNEHLRNHYDKKKVTHSQMMMKAFDNLRNELLEIVNKKDEEIIKLKEDSARKETSIMEMNQRMNDNDERRNEDFFQEINNNEKREKDLQVIREDLKTKEILITEIKQEVDYQRIKIEELKVIDVRRCKEMEAMKETQQKTMMEELKNVKKDIEKLDVRGDIKDQRREIEKLKDKNEKMVREIEDMKETQKKTIMNELENVKKDIMERDFNKSILINLMQQQADDQRKEVEKLKNKDERRDREIEVMKETQQKTMMDELENVKRDIMERDVNKSTQRKTMMEELENVKRDIVERDVRGDIEDRRKSLNDLRENQKNIEREINSVVIKVRDAQIFDEREFIWRVNHFSKMREDRRWRRVILRRYSLKLCLYLRCYGDYLEFYCTILKGEFDGRLEWPMKHKITLSLINQASMKSHKSVEYRHDSFEGDKSVFDKPKNNFENYVGEYNFVTIKEITDTPGLFSDDSFVVSLNIDY